jgi:hypothetical protein
MITTRIRAACGLLSLLVTVIIAFPVQGMGGTVFGPKQYVRTNGAPNTYTDTFQSRGGSGSLIIRNGKAAVAGSGEGKADNYTITSAKVYLNGALICSPNDFKSAAYYMEKPIQLKNGTNVLHAELSSSPGSYMTAEVIGAVAPSITLNIATPSDGATLFKPTFTIGGTVANTSGAQTGVVVNGVIARVYGGQFAANNVPLIEGQNTITVTATDANGATAVKSITVNAAASEHFIKLTPYPDSGEAPLEVTLRIDGSFSIANPVITPTGPGSVEQLASTRPDEYKYRIPTEGLYTLAVAVAGPDGNTYTDTICITVSSLAQIDSLLRAKWAGLQNALKNRDISAALTMLRPISKNRYQTQLNLVIDQLPAIVATHTGLVLESIQGDFAYYELKTVQNGSVFSYRVIFSRDPSSGLWLIEEF